jgi:hypothetical protein
LTNWGFIWLPVLAGRALIKDAFVRRLLIVPPTQIALLFFVGVFYEMRIYGESLPIVLAAFAIIAYEVSQRLSLHQTKMKGRTSPESEFESGAERGSR